MSSEQTIHSFIGECIWASLEWPIEFIQQPRHSIGPSSTCMCVSLTKGKQIVSLYSSFQLKVICSNIYEEKGKMTIPEASTQAIAPCGMFVMEIIGWVLDGGGGSCLWARDLLPHSPTQSWCSCLMLIHNKEKKLLQQRCFVKQVEF